MNINTSSAVVDFTYADACALVTQIAQTGEFPKGKSITEVQTNVHLVAKRLGDNMFWKEKVQKAQVILGIEIMNRAVENAGKRAEDSQRALKVAAENAVKARQTRHEKNLRHRQNKIDKALKNSVATGTAKASGTRSGPALHGHGKDKKGKK